MFTPSPMTGLIVFLVLGCCALLGYRLGLGNKRTGVNEPGPLPPRADHSRELEELRRQMEMLSSSTLGVADRVQRLAGEVAEVRDNVQEVSSSSAAGTYTPAIKMAASGCPVDELVENFGLSRGEAELLRKLHGEERSQATRRGLRH